MSEIMQNIPVIIYEPSFDAPKLPMGYKWAHRTDFHLEKVTLTVSIISTKNPGQCSAVPFGRSRSFPHWLRISHEGRPKMLGQRCRKQRRLCSDNFITSYSRQHKRNRMCCQGRNRLPSFSISAPSLPIANLLM